MQHENGIFILLIIFYNNDFNFFDTYLNDTIALWTTEDLKISFLFTHWTH